MCAAQVGDPGAHPLFSGVALKRATVTESAVEGLALEGGEEASVRFLRCLFVGVHFS